MTAMAVAWRRNGGAKGTLALIGIFAALALAVLFVTIRMPSPSLTYTVVMTGLAALAGWMFVSENYPLTLGVLLLYLGLLDGFVKLSTGIGFATLGRDVLLYAI